MARRADIPNSVHVDYQINPQLNVAELQSLFDDAWPEHGLADGFLKVLHQSLGFVCAYVGDRLVGFVYVAWDGGAHAFLLDPVVRRDARRQGIGSELVRRAAALARSQGIEWLHVDYEPHLAGFYTACGFQPTAAGLMKLND